MPPATLDWRASPSPSPTDTTKCSPESPPGPCRPSLPPEFEQKGPAYSYNSTVGIAEVNVFRHGGLELFVRCLFTRLSLHLGI